MADLNSTALLADALKTEDQSYLASSPSYYVSQALSQPVQYQQGTNVKPWQALLANGLQSFVSGAAGQYTKRGVKENRANFMQNWADASSQPDKVNAFQNNPLLRDYAPQISLMEQQQAAQAKAEKQKKLEDFQLKEIGEGFYFNPETGRAEQYPGYAETQAANAAAVTLANEKVKNRIESQKPKEPKAGYGDDLRSELSQKSDYKDYRMVKKGTESVLKAMNDPSSVADIELTYAIIHAIEPGLSVKEGEFAAVEKSQSIPENVKGTLRRALSGDNVYDEKTRKDMLRLVMRRYHSHKEAYKDLLGGYSELAKRKGVDPRDLSILGNPDEIETKYDPESNKLYRVLRDENGKAYKKVEF